MENLKPFEQIAALRAERGETLAQFALAVGISSKGRISEMEKGLVFATVAQALAIEKLSDGRIDAAALNKDVALSRTAISQRVGTGDDPDIFERIKDYASDPAGDPVDLDRVVICDVCDNRVDQMTACTFVDCPHSERRAA